MKIFIIFSKIKKTKIVIIVLSLKILSFQEASLPGEPKETDIQEYTIKENHKEPEIRPVIDTLDKTKTTITNGLKKYLDQNKLKDETFSDELIRLLSRK